MDCDAGQATNRQPRLPVSWIWELRENEAQFIGGREPHRNFGEMVRVNLKRSQDIVLMKLNWKEGKLGEGLRCYRALEFFAAHEHWESVWLEAGEPEKTFLQSLIQVAAAFHHLQRGNPQGTHSLLLRARVRLEPYPQYFGSMDVTSLRKEIGDWLQVLESGTATAGRPYPHLF